MSNQTSTVTDLRMRLTPGQPGLNACGREFAGMTDEQLDAELSRCLRVTAEDMKRLAGILREKENRGHDISAFRMCPIHSLRLIASGQLLPEILVAFIGQPSLVRAIGSLPISDQERIARGEPLKLVVFGSGGQTDTRMVAPRLLGSKEIKQLFDRDHIRDEAEQAMYLDRQRQKQIRKAPDRVGVMRIDKERGGVTVGNHFISEGDLASALKALRK